MTRAERSSCSYSRPRPTFRGSCPLHPARQRMFSLRKTKRLRASDLESSRSNESSRRKMSAWPSLKRRSSSSALKLLTKTTRLNSTQTRSRSSRMRTCFSRLEGPQPPWLRVEAAPSPYRLVSRSSALRSRTGRRSARYSSKMKSST